jgi:regulator of replication initiation timing
MPEDLYQAMLADKPVEIKISSWLLILLRKGLNVAVDKSSTLVDNCDRNDLADKVRKEVNQLATEIRSELHSTIAPIKEQLGAYLEKCDRLAAESQALREKLTDIRHVPDIEIQTAKPLDVSQEVEGELRLELIDIELEQKAPKKAEILTPVAIHRPKQQRTWLSGETFDLLEDLPVGSIPSIELADLSNIDATNIGRWQKKGVLEQMTKERTGKAYKYAGKLGKTNYYYPCADFVDA